MKPKLASRRLGTPNRSIIYRKTQILIKFLNKIFSISMLGELSDDITLDSLR